MKLTRYDAKPKWSQSFKDAGVILLFIIGLVGTLMLVQMAHDNLKKSLGPSTAELFCGNGTIMYGHSINYCNGHPFKCSGGYCTYITGMAEDTYRCGHLGRSTCIEEIPLG